MRSEIIDAPVNGENYLLSKDFPPGTLVKAVTDNIFLNVEFLEKSTATNLYTKVRSWVLVHVGDKVSEKNICAITSSAVVGSILPPGSGIKLIQT